MSLTGGIGVSLKSDDQELKYASSTGNQAIIIQYLRSISTKSASIDEIKKECQVDLYKDSETFSLLRKHKKITSHLNDKKIWYFQYLEKYKISNKYELLRLISHEHDAYVGIALEDIRSCYDGIQQDIDTCLRCGDLIACRNQDTKDKILFPRHQAFISPLSGLVTAFPNKNYVKTSMNLVPEIRRGDAICIDQQWFRVSSSTKSNSLTEPLRSVAPLSVSSEKEMSSQNVYIEKFDEERLPIDAPFQCEDEVEHRAYKHGCTNDIRSIWAVTIEGMRNLIDDHAIEKELVSLGLIAPPERVTERTKESKDVGKQEPKQKRMRLSKKQLNTHLVGTEYGAILEEAQAQMMLAHQKKS